MIEKCSKTHIKKFEKKKTILKSRKKKSTKKTPKNVPVIERGKKLKKRF